MSVPQKVLYSLAHFSVFFGSAHSVGCAFLLAEKYFLVSALYNPLSISSLSCNNSKSLTRFLKQVSLGLSLQRRHKTKRKVSRYGEFVPTS